MTIDPVYEVHIEMRTKLGCYRCTCLNASCHLTCVDYEEVLNGMPKESKERLLENASRRNSSM